MWRPPCWCFPTRGAQPSQPDSIEDSTECNMRPFVCSGVPASHFALPPPLRHFSPAPTCRHSELFFPLAWGAGGEGAGSGARPGAAAEGQDSFWRPACPLRKDRRQRTQPAPSQRYHHRRAGFPCRSNVCTSRAGRRIKASGYSLSLPWSVDAPRYLHGTAQDAPLLVLLAFAAQMLHQVTQREVRARVITEHPCRCGEFGPGQLATPLVTTHSTCWTVASHRRTNPCEILPADPMG